MVKWYDSGYMKQVGLQGRKGFTIVELVIVIAVIGVLAALTMVAYTSAQRNSNDAAIRADLKTIGGQIQTFIASELRVPTSSADLTSIRMKPTKNSYGAHYVAGGLNYNFLYCYNATTLDFTLVAASKTGNVYKYSDGTREGTGPLVTYLTTCSNNGMSTSTAMWLYSGGVWQYGM